MRKKSWFLGVLVGVLILLSTVAYAKAWVDGGIWRASVINDCESGAVCADWDLEGTSATNCCIDPTGLNTSDTSACDPRTLRHPHDG